jgi:hypothetical protein
MTDHQLSTRDLATRTDNDQRDSSLENQQPAKRTTDTDPTGDRVSGLEGAHSDASLTRDPAARATRTHDSASAGTEHEPLLPPDQSERFTSRWQEIQTSFVDQPRDAVAQADALVADLMQRLAASFSQERERLEANWDRADDVSTEDLRVALTRYRSFFDRLLSA